MVCLLNVGVLLALASVARARAHVDPSSNFGFDDDGSLSRRSSLSGSAKSLFDAAMQFNDAYWDEAEGYLISTDSAGIHDTRATAMYATGLLGRNGNNGADVKRAERIFQQVASQQYTTNGTMWYGTYPHTPQDPFPGTDLLGTSIYKAYDPNWRDFVATAWSLGLSQNSHLLSSSVISTLEQSILFAAKGNLVRYQGRGPYANSVSVNTSADNLDEAYTNPWLMGTFVMGFIGHRLNDTDLLAKSDEDAQAIYDLFTYGGFNTFSEYNSATYTGVDLWMLALWLEHSPPDSKMRKYAPFLLEHTLADVGLLYNAKLRNLAGPFDRTYGYDMTRYHSILGYFITSLAPSTLSASPFKLFAGLHIGDFACYGPLVPLLSSTIEKAAPAVALDSFRGKLKGGRLVERKVRTNTGDVTAYRNITTWIGETISIGGESLDEPSPRQSSNVAGLIQWALPISPDAPAGSAPKIGYIALSPPAAGVVNATASPGQLEISYPPSTKFPNATEPTSITFRIGGFDLRTSGANMTKGLEGVPGVKVLVVTEGLGSPSTHYDIDSSFNGFYGFVTTYNVTSTWPEVPKITINIS